MEICTYIVEGSLTHQDSMGTQETLGKFLISMVNVALNVVPAGRGAIQFMTAGTGVTHSEHNLDKHNPLRFVQIWITTRKRGLKPNYGSFGGDEPGRQNAWLGRPTVLSSYVPILNYCFQVSSCVGCAVIIIDTHSNQSRWDKC